MQLDCGTAGCNNASQQALFNATQQNVNFDVLYLTEYLLRFRASDRDSSVYPTSLMEYLTSLQVGYTTVVYAKPFFEESERSAILEAVDRRLTELGAGNWRAGADVVLARIYGRSYVPVRVANFTATYLGSTSVRLRWTTASEVDNEGFLVERRKQSDSAFAELPGSFMPGQGISEIPHEYSFVDSTLTSGDWLYRLKQIDQSGSTMYTNPVSIHIVITHVASAAPLTFALEQNYPNPFNPTTVVSYQLPVANQVELIVYDLLSREVATLVNEYKPAGVYTVKFDAGGLASGMYLYRLHAGSFVETRKLLLLR